MGISKKHLTKSQRKAKVRFYIKVTEEDRKRNELRGPCPFCVGPNTSFLYNYGTDRFTCTACHASGDLEGLYIRVNGLDKKSGRAAFCREHGLQLKYFEIGINGRLSLKPRLLADEILRDMDILYDTASGKPYNWSGKCWKQYDERHIVKEVLLRLGKEATQNRAKDATFQVLGLSAIPPGRALNDQKEKIGLNNCMLHVKDLTQHPHAKDDYCTVVLPFDFDPDDAVKCERWNQFLDETVQAPAPIAQLQEYSGYCLTMDTRFSKCLLLIGPGADGKSVFLKTLRKLIGLENSCAISFQDLEDQFLRSSIYGKLLNISTEVGSKALESPYFKAIVSGDPVSAAYKHRNTFTFTPHCKLAFASNKLPRVLDNSDGFFRRILPVSFKRQFLNDADPDLESKLESELPGIFKWALVGLHRLWKQKGFTDCDETREQIIGYRRLNNPVLGFVEESCLLGDEYETEKDGLYTEYRKYCSAGGFTAMNKNNFFRELYSAISDLKQFRPRVNGVQDKRFVKGITVNMYTAGE